MQYNIFQNLPAQAMTPEVSRKLLAYQEGQGGYTLNLMQAQAGAQAPAHSHPHQQVVYIISGRGDFLCGEETQTLVAGDVVQIAANVPHTFVSVAEDTVWLEFFTPAREDYRPQQ